MTGTDGTGGYRFPARSAVAPPRAACAGTPQARAMLQRRIGSALIKVEETGALRRCPPPFRQSISQHPGLRAKRVSCDTPPCHPPAFDEELGGSAAQPRRRCTLPAQHLDLDGAAQPLQAEAGGRVLLADPLAPGVLRGRGADLQAGGPRRELREAAPRRPEEAALDLDTKAGGEGQGGRGAGVRPGCGAGVWRNVRIS
eukprot:COSAG04_NODE_30_length_35898_cov_42.288053_12_plen_199_part_00